MKLNKAYYQTFDDDLDDSNIVSLTSSRKSSFAGSSQEAGPSAPLLTTSQITAPLSAMNYQHYSMPSTEVSNIPSLTLTSFDEPSLAGANFNTLSLDGCAAAQPPLDFGIDPRQLDLNLDRCLASMDLDPFQFTFDGDISDFGVDVTDLFMF